MVEDDFGGGGDSGWVIVGSLWEWWIRDMDDDGEAVLEDVTESFGSSNVSVVVVV